MTNPRLYVHPASLQRLKYPFLMFNMAENRRLGRERWFRENWFEHAILDAGVETFFFVRKLKDYPKEFLKMYQYRAQVATNHYGKDKVWVTIPDYPDDYQHGLTWENSKTNVEKTFENIERFKQFTEIEWIYPIQCNYLNRKSFREACKKLREEVNPKIVGIGTVCKTKNIQFITFCIKEARLIFGQDTWIHAFGPTLLALPKIWFFLNSFDSSAQFYINGHLVSSVEERIEAFQIWYEKVELIIQSNQRRLFEEVDNKCQMRY